MFGTFQVDWVSRNSSIQLIVSGLGQKHVFDEIEYTVEELFLNVCKSVIFCIDGQVK